MTTTTTTSCTISPEAVLGTADTDQSTPKEELGPVLSSQDQHITGKAPFEGTSVLVHRDKLRACEEIIERIQINGWVGIGGALKTIRNSGLYEGQYGTFDEYLRRRWNLERTYAHRLIKAAEVYDNLLPIGNIVMPTSEAQVRPLTRLEPAMQIKAWQTAVRKAGPEVPTARVVDTAARVFVRRVKAKEMTAPPRLAETAPHVGEEEIVTDAPAPSESHANDEQPVQPAEGVNSITPVDDREESARKNGTNPEAAQPADDSKWKDTAGTDLSAPQTLVESRNDADLPAVPLSASVTLDHTGGSSPGVRPTEQQVLIPAEIVEQAAQSVSARDLGGSTDREMVALMRALVAPVADLLGQLAEAYPNYSGRELSQALGMVNTKLQIASGWV